MGKFHRSDIPWLEIERRWKAGESSRQIAKDYDISHAAVNYHVRKEGWTRDLSADWNKEVRQTETARLVAAPATHGERRIATLGKTTPETAARILVLIEAGATYALAAGAVGIGASTLTDWRKRDPEFDAILTAKRCAFLAKQTTNVALAGDRGDWKAAAHMLAKSPETKGDWGDGPGAGHGTINVILNWNRDDEPPKPVIDITPTRD